MKIVDLRGRYFKEDESIEFLIKRGDIETEKYEPIVKTIIKEVKERGDEALVEFTEKFDKVKLNPEDLVIPFEELEKAYNEIEDDVRWAYEVAYERIYEFHENQKEKSFFKEEEGMILGQKITPLEVVGLYVPGGKAAYPSSVIMNTAPAKGSRC